MPEVTQSQTPEPVQTPVQAQQAAPPTPAPPRPARKKGKKKMIQRFIALAVVLAILGGVGYGMWYLVFREDDSTGAPLTDVSRIGSIQSVVQGYGNAVPKESAAITLSADGTVQEVYVTVGQTVWAGDPLYTIDSQAARDALEKAQEDLKNANEELADRLEKAANLTVRAPFAGKLQDVTKFDLDQDVHEGETVATLVNDKKLKLSLYFSYAYENDIYEGQDVHISVPAVMRSFDGKVEKINKVSYITPEGSVHFEAVIVFDNPGTLTAGMDASAVLSTADGLDIYPYANGRTEFYEIRTIRTKVSGPVIDQGNLLNHANVAEGEALLMLGSSTIDSDIREQREKVQKCQEVLEKAQEGLDNFSAVAPIDGQVFSCTLEPGQEVKGGETVITISNTTTMLVDIQVDSRNIGFIQAGMTMELSDDWGNPCYGTVTNVAMSGEVGSGTTTYPVQLEVDNSNGTIYNGSWLNYKLVTAESTDCVVIPNQCVKRVVDVNGETYTVVFVKTDSRPDNAVDLDEAMLGDTMPSPDEGFWPVPVTHGISDTYNVEIVEGLEPGVEVFTNRETNYSSGW